MFTSLSSGLVNGTDGGIQNQLGGVEFGISSLILILWGLVICENLVQLHLFVILNLLHFISNQTTRANHGSLNKN